jgi:putative sigma-54 modulation protein
MMMMMMGTAKVKVYGRHLHLTEALRSGVDFRLQRVFDSFDFLKQVDIALSVESPQAHKAKATLHVNGRWISVDACTENLYASLDLLMDKVSRTLRKYKTKALGRGQRRRLAAASQESFRWTAWDEEAVADEPAATRHKAVRAENRLALQQQDVDEDIYALLNAMDGSLAELWQDPEELSLLEDLKRQNLA